MKIDKNKLESMPAIEIDEEFSNFKLIFLDNCKNINIKKYISKAGGYECLYPSEIGKLVELSYEDKNYIFRHFFEKEYNNWYLGKGIRKSHIKEINKLLENIVPYKLTIDESKIEESLEAWIYVNIHNFKSKKGVLIFPNSD